MESWKQVVESYEISDFGNCRKKLSCGRYKSIKGSIQNRGYRYFQIQREGKRLNYLFHHLVAIAFIGERPDNLVVDHIDRNKLNNHVANLRYVTQKENTHNQPLYRHDITTDDVAERHRILSRESDRRRGRVRDVRRPKGTGQIVERNGRFRACITLNKKRYMKTCDSRDLAEDYIKEIVGLSTPENF